MLITKKIITSVLENWNDSTSSIMDSQKKYNEAALSWSKPRLENWLKEFDNATT